MLEVGYVPYSLDLTHPADRRRLGSWSKVTSVKLNTATPLESEILFLSNAANFSYWIERANQPVVLDLVDGYLGESPKLARDFSRNALRSMSGSSQLRWITYTNHLREACRRSSGIIVASPEQKDIVTSLNPRVDIILDNHQELIDYRNQLAKLPGQQSLSNRKNLFWEGLSVNLKHFEHIGGQIDSFLNECNWGFYIVTSNNLPRWGNSILPRDTEKYVRSIFKKSANSVKVIPWSVENVIKYASKSLVSVIPIDLEDRFAVLKSENKLLSMWSIPIATLTSRTHAYERVAKESRTEEFIVESGLWYTTLKILSENLDRVQRLQIRGLEYVMKTHRQEDIINSWQKVMDKYV